MLIHLSPKDPRPMYEQIVAGIQRLIVLEIMPVGEKLPSIRGLSKELMTSAITVRRAYQELENSGFVYTRPGRGSFVAELSEEQLFEWKISQVKEPLQISISRAKSLQVNKDDFQAVVDKLWESISKEEE